MAATPGRIFAWVEPDSTQRPSFKGMVSVCNDGYLLFIFEQHKYLKFGIQFSITIGLQYTWEVQRMLESASGRSPWPPHVRRRPGREIIYIFPKRIAGVLIIIRFKTNRALCETYWFQNHCAGRRMRLTELELSHLPRSFHRRSINGWSVEEGWGEIGLRWGEM